jgi:hypothetical protein
MWTGASSCTTPATGVFSASMVSSGMSARFTTTARSQCAFTAHEAMRMASRIFWTFSRSTGRSGSK